MGLYEAAKDLFKFAQKLDNPELIQKVLDVQQMALEMQKEQFALNTALEEQAKQIEHLKDIGELHNEGDHGWLIDDKNPNIKYCPVCAGKDKIRNAMSPSSTGRVYHCFMHKVSYE